MDESKAKRLIIAGTVGAVVLAVILLIVMIYQLIAIGVKNNKIDQINQRIAELDLLIENSENKKEAIKEKNWIIYEAQKLGYYFEGAIPEGEIPTE